MTFDFRNKKVLLVVGAILVAVLAWVIYRRREHKSILPKLREPYMAAGALDHLDSLDPRYDLVQAPESAVPSEHFADLVGAGDQAMMVGQPSRTPGDENLRPLERFERVDSRNMMPSTAAHLPQHNIDSANMSTYAFAVQGPTVQLPMNKVKRQADPWRGDIVIRNHPDIALVGKSQYGRESIRLDGFFSDHYSHLYNKLTGRSYKNVPLKVATQGTVLDYVSQ